VTLPPSDSFWDTYFPPNGWNCRCTVVQVRKDAAAPTDHDEAMRLGRAALKGDKKGMFDFNSGKQERTFPAYNPYTISKCATCPKAELKLAAGLPGNENCAACQLIKLMIGEKEKINHLAEYERLKADKNYKDVAFDEESGGVKATHISHKTKTSKMERFFGVEEVTDLDLEKECQNEIFKNGGKCILLSEGERSASGDFRPALDSMSFDAMMDIRSITVNSKSYRNAICDKNEQLHRYNADHGTNMDSLCLYFHDPDMYDPNKMLKGYRKQYTQQNKTTENIIKHIYCVVKGKGIYRFDF